MPIRARSFGRSVLRSPTEMPATVMVPCWNGSRPLTHLISVDLPEPEGPHTTTTSPLATSVEQSFKTWKVWYHLLTLLSVIMAAPEESLVLRMLYSKNRFPLFRSMLEVLAFIAFSDGKPVSTFPEN